MFKRVEFHPNVNGNIRAIANVTFDLGGGHELSVTGIRVVIGNYGLWCAWPSRKNGNQFVDVVYGNKLLHEAMTKHVLEQFKLSEHYCL